MGSKSNTGATRALNVQVPGQAPNVQPETATSEVASTSEAEKHSDTASVAGPDMEAVIARIRDEERANARAELATEMQSAMKAASSVIGESAPARTGGPTKAQYANMRSDEVDPATLTAPVLTRDGYLCPSPAAPKK